MQIKYHPQFLNDMKRLFSRNPIYSVPRFFSDTQSRIKWGLQRAFRGYDDTWTWSFYSQLSEIAPKCFRQMKKGMGYPSILNSHKKWRDILEKIAKGFEAVGKMDDCKYNSKRYKNWEKQHDEGMKLFVRYFRNLWD